MFWLAGAWVGANRAQKRTFGKEGYALGEDVQHLDQVVITPRQKRTTVAFLISFVLLVGYGIATKQGTNYALMVMIVLAAVVAIFGGIEIDRSVDCITKGVASQANMFLIFVSIDVLLNLVTLGGGFDALSNLLGGLAGNSPTAVMLVASVVGGFGIEAAAVAEIQIITDMFGGLAAQVGLPMGCFAVSILAATRLTGSAYPTTNFAGQLGTAQCSNTKEALQACWISVAFACVFVVAYSFIGPLILGWPAGLKRVKKSPLYRSVPIQGAAFLRRSETSQIPDDRPGQHQPGGAGDKGDRAGTARRGRRRGRCPPPGELRLRGGQGARGSSGTRPPSGGGCPASAAPSASPGPGAALRFGQVGDGEGGGVQLVARAHGADERDPQGMAADGQLQLGGDGVHRVHHIVVPGQVHLPRRFPAGRTSAGPAPGRRG